MVEMVLSYCSLFAAVISPRLAGIGKSLSDSCRGAKVQPDMDDKPKQQMGDSALKADVLAYELATHG